MVKWSVVFLNRDVEAVLLALPRDIRASFERIVHLIEAHGLPLIREPYVKHLEGPLWEMRMKGKDGIARAAYVTATGRRVVGSMSFPKRHRRCRAVKLPSLFGGQRRWYDPEKYPCRRGN